MEIREILAKAIENDVSDIFIVAGLPLVFKVNGRQQRLDTAVYSPKDTQMLVESIYDLCHRSKSRLSVESEDDDFSFAIPELGRFRANILRQRGSFAAVIRVIHFGLPSPEQLSIPPQVMSVTKYLKGLVLVTGPAGNGKSTTLACIIDEINRTREGHIITMEDPIEYIHKHQKCIVTQREIVSDIQNYIKGLRSALRESPDVILLGEMRDFETIEVAMTAAETGQLLLSTLHTVGAANTVDRIIDVFPADQQRQIRMQLSMILQAVISQQLIPTIEGGLVPAFEIMFTNPAIKNLIREAKTHQIDSVIQAGGAEGMYTMDSSLLKYYQQGIISKDTAMTYCVNTDSMLRKLGS